MGKLFLTGALPATVNYLLLLRKKITFLFNLLLDPLVFSGSVSAIYIAELSD